MKKIVGIFSCIMLVLMLATALVAADDSTQFNNQHQQYQFQQFCQQFRYGNLNKRRISCHGNEYHHGSRSFFPV